MKKNILFLFIFSLVKISFCQWTVQNSGTTYDLNAIHFQNNSVGYCWSYDGVHLKTTNGGTNWNLFPEADAVDIIGFFDPDTILGFTATLSPDSVNVSKSTDGGFSWNTVSTFFHDTNTPYLYIAVSFPTTSVGYMTTPNASLDTVNFRKTIDGGATWNILSSYPFPAGAIYFKNADTGFFSFQAGELLRTTDGGASWFPVFNSPSGNTVTDIYFPTPSIGYASSVNHYVKTTDGGLSWIEDTVPYIGGYRALDCPNVNTCYVVGISSTATLIQTTDGGINWSQAPLTNWLYDVDFVNDSVGYTCGVNGTILKYGAGPSSVNEYSIEKFTIYPNPAKEFTTLSFDNPNKENSKVIIYNGHGEIVKEINIINASTIQIDLKSLAAGLYNIQLYSDHQKFRGSKFIVE